MPKPSAFKTLTAYRAALSVHMAAAGRKGGAARAKALSKKERSAIASLGGKAKQAKARGKQKEGR